MGWNLPTLATPGLRSHPVRFVPTPKGLLSILPALRDAVGQEEEASYLDTAPLISSAQDLQDLCLAYIC